MPRGTRTAAAAVVLLLVLDGLAAVQVARNRRPPSFDRGGRFRRALSPEAAAAATTTVPPSAGPTTTTAAPAATSLSAPAPQPTTTDVPSTSASPLPATVARPAAGTYTYTVDGSESATGFGSRSLGPQMSVVAHGGGGAGADEMVFDVEFSWQHEEREILAYRPDGVSLTYEGGSITFGPVTETSSASMEPPLTLVPAPLEAGSTRRGTSTARGGDGGTIRVDDWTSRVLRRETVATALGRVEAWVVAIERRSRPGTSERVTQSVTWWFDPARNIPVKVAEDLHGERDAAVTLRYDASYVAALAAFGPA